MPNFRSAQIWQAVLRGWHSSSLSLKTSVNSNQMGDKQQENLNDNLNGHYYLNITIDWKTRKKYITSGNH